MNQIQKSERMQTITFDPSILGELRLNDFRGVPWTSCRFKELMFEEEKSIIRRAVLRLIKLDEEAYATAAE